MKISPKDIKEKYKLKVSTVLEKHENIQLLIKTKIDNLNSFYVVEEDGYNMHSGKDLEEVVDVFNKLVSEINQD